VRVGGRKGEKKGERGRVGLLVPFQIHSVRKPLSYSIRSNWVNREVEGERAES